ncbi:MAG TPA: 23S ribosomal RNA methyltransferase Erm [Candidatus Agrococcus pullicola]|uniref:23S ribosomal RNA methyltransferase Erm n=1 Tax=Candidatus Agrococcus pullicola TaxID=2838429 RepID=A0A9D1YXG4_9MICO|nr:23S ribosomal RNA methyltransferase Erm [Candidatus Agrococcus pullicola]
MRRSHHGGRHELGQNFLTHKPTVSRIATVVAGTSGSILEIGAGGGALTGSLARLGRPLTAIDIDEHRVGQLRRRLRGVEILQADAMRHPLDANVVVGNIPFHITTPLLRRLLQRRNWRSAVLLTQWEVARKRAGVGGSTMMSAQAAPWFEFSLEMRVPAWAFTPKPSVDGGVLRIERRESPLIPLSQRRGYEAFVKTVFTGRGGSLAASVGGAARVPTKTAKRALRDAGVRGEARLRDLAPEHWAGLWQRVQR